MAGNMEKAQPRSRQRPVTGIGGGGTQSPALVMCKGGKMQTGMTVLMWLEKHWSTDCQSGVASARSAPDRNKIHQILNFSQSGMYTVPQLTLTLKEMVSHEGLQTQFWGQNRPRGQGALAVLTQGGSVREATGDPRQARTSLRDCGHPCPRCSRDIPEGLWQSTDTPESKFIKKTYNC